MISTLKTVLIKATVLMLYRCLGQNLQKKDVLANLHINHAGPRIPSGKRWFLVKSDLGNVGCPKGVLEERLFGFSFFKFYLYLIEYLDSRFSPYLDSFTLVATCAPRSKRIYLDSRKTVYSHDTSLVGSYPRRTRVGNRRDLSTAGRYRKSKA